MKIKQFGSGYAIYDGVKRMTGALRKDVAERNLVILSMEKNGFIVIFNPEKKSLSTLKSFYKQYFKKCKIVRKTVNGEIFDFMK